MGYSQEQLDQIEFRGEKRFLSNMFKCEFRFDTMHGLSIPGVEPTNLVYHSSEHLYQSLKSHNIAWHELLLTKTPEGTKNAARKKLKTLLANNKETFLIREDWHDIKLNVMKLVLLLKFSQNRDLADKLKMYQGHIEERNCWGDRFWGTVHGTGDNNLGISLMAVRDLLIKNNL